MDVIILNGSPRKNGNTFHALEAIRKGLLAAHPEAKISIVRAYDLNLKGCVACNCCRKNGGSCVLPDGTAEVMNQIAAADFLLIGSPVYFAGITGKLKLLLDKFHSKVGLFGKQKKRIGIVAVGGAKTDDPAYELISRQFRGIAEFFGWPVVIDLAISAHEEDDLANNAVKLAELEAAGTKL